MAAQRTDHRSVVRFRKSFGAPLPTLRYINVVKRNLYKSFRMKKTASNSPWNPIATAPAHVELELCVYDGEEYDALVFPCRRNGVGWSDVRLNKMVPIRPTHWRLWGYESTR
jgi:hypothetical protein